MDAVPLPIKEEVEVVEEEQQQRGKKKKAQRGKS
jgi:hypothetical protein